MKGRPAKPHEQHVMEGTHRPDRHAALPAVLSGRQLVERPVGLTPVQAQIWDWLTAELADARLLQATDAPMLEQFVIAVDYAHKSAEEVEARGIIYEEEHYDKDGNPTHTVLKKNPALAAWKESVTIAKQLAEHFGLTPSARARLGIQAVVGMTAAKQLEKTIGVNPLDFLEGESREEDE